MHANSMMLRCSKHSQSFATVKFAETVRLQQAKGCFQQHEKIIKKSRVCTKYSSKFRTQASVKNPSPLSGNKSFT